jgi:hypothetical protein
LVLQKDTRLKKSYHQLVADFLDIMKPLALELLEKNCTLGLIGHSVSKDKSPTSHAYSVSSGTKGQSRALLCSYRKGASFTGGFYAPLADDLKKFKEIAYYDDLEASK